MVLNSQDPYISEATNIGQALSSIVAPAVATLGSNGIRNLIENRDKADKKVDLPNCRLFPSPFGVTLRTYDGDKVKSDTNVSWIIIVGLLIVLGLLVAVDGIFFQFQVTKHLLKFLKAFLGS